MGHGFSRLKENVVYAWMFEKLGEGRITEDEIMLTYDCQNEKEWLYRVEELSGKVDDRTPMEILKGHVAFDAAK